MKLTRQQEQYVETVDELMARNGIARTVDVARKLGVSAASVSEAVGRLARARILVRRSWHEIGLTRRGKAVALQLTERHGALRRFMAECLGMGDREADETACLVEHCVGAEFARRLADFVDSGARRGRNRRGAGQCKSK